MNMYYTTSVTSKGQTTIPADIRKYLQVETGSRVVFSLRDDMVVIEPEKSFVNLRGIIKSKKKIANAEWDKAILDLVKHANENS
ncbi:MAG TPA: AbrB/MazE/SpoVT family DNA-binding domain-containing protein [Candidatus Woesebacteria bacterium]|jgi:AbrB family looped-hinge helix DNA binding protein|nr:AbrB/MazE/SpoVT family DNA-binding domain-containing protein [Candidatus Woesebacteria bacterium]